MRLKLDENLPESLVPALAALGHEVDNVRREGLVGRSDPDIWQAAQSGGRFLITQDFDFSDLRRYAPGTHHGLLLLRIRLPGRRALAMRLSEVFRSENVESWARCFVLVTDRKIRVHQPQS
jgi:predicted nuclease of predicted toxin-antitoxin system